MPSVVPEFKKKEKKKHKLKCTFKDYKQKLHETQKIESIQMHWVAHLIHSTQSKRLRRARLHGARAQRSETAGGKLPFFWEDFFPLSGREFMQLFKDL